MAKRYQSAEAILRELGDNATQAAKSALADGVELVVKEAKERCPVYKGHDSRVVKGALKNSIHAVKLKGGAKYKIIADAVSHDGIFYGKLVEFSPKINKPFMYPALDAQRDTVRKLIVEAVQKAVRKK
ncbi:HK97 gp10 family phage protein [Selenomonas ruminantium]|uniref:Bacteriophage HK97-gp10, putative tail-component n=1 Tax=Selenomonas ruminantium TaxID=971 RepID=A0A1I0V616_SELRU|nr:HK97 gp10 family phage protein [Selenomonas ruminantium]SFA71513.1 Bacteriophage HK97-gp10, putative tail-component [Selenomonas ruminantium]